MAKITRPNYQNIWANSGSISVVNPTKINLGWQVEIPPFEEANFIENRQDRAIVHILQMGIAEWDAGTEYQIGSHTNHNGLVYRATAVNINKNPSSNPSFWIRTGVDYSDFATVRDKVNSNDPYPVYVKANAPVMTELAQAPSFTKLGNIGTGLFFSGNDLVFKSQGVDRGRIRFSALASTEDSDALATTQWVRDLVESVRQEIMESIVPVNNESIKVGGLYFTMADYTVGAGFSQGYATGEMVAAALGYGTWKKLKGGYILNRLTVQEAQARGLDNNAEVKALGKNFGDAYITNDQIGTSNHAVLQPTMNTSGDVAIGNIDGNGNVRYAKWKKVGYHGQLTDYTTDDLYTMGDQPFLPMYITVDVWQRTA